MTTSEARERADRAIGRCRELATYSEIPGETTRPFLCASAKTVHAHVTGWMEMAGLQVRVDGMGNLRGLSRTERQGVSSGVLLGSHLDTVPAAGAFDGILGVVLAIEAADATRTQGLPFALEVIGFSEEEGVRFGRPFLGSLALVGRGSELLELRDGNGLSVAQALQHFGTPDSTTSGLAPETAAYIEVHVEQGPMLEVMDCSIGVVDAIAGQSRYTLRFIGHSNHAGTTPMRLRRDALAAAAEWMVAVEACARAQEGLVATVGRIQVSPGASNIIPGQVTVSLDVRHRQDHVREQAVRELLAAASSSAEARGVTVGISSALDQRTVAMDPNLVEQLTNAATAVLCRTPPRMSSGAGHDAMILADRVPAAMLFVRSPGGLSHHPDESVLPDDVADALRALVRFLQFHGARATANDEGSPHA